MESTTSVLGIFLIFISFGCEGSFEQSNVDKAPLDPKIESSQLENKNDTLAVAGEPDQEEVIEDEVDEEVEEEMDEEIVDDPVPTPETRPEVGSVVMFEIPPGTGDGEWNSSAAPLVAYVGQILLIVNKDSETHQLHVSGGGPTNHGEPMAANGGAQEFELTAVSPIGDTTPFYDHIDGSSAGFWLEIRP